MEIEKKVLSANDQIAARLRDWLQAKGALAVNLIGSPGAGKTTLLEKTLDMLPAGTRAAVLTGDIQTDNDARRLGRYGYPVRQITTAGACHLDARMVENHLTDWLNERLELLLIENVGNLVCPTSYDLGEDAKIVVLSVTEGEDKPLKYPGIFRKAELMILNKIDLLPYVPFDPQLALENARRIHPGIEIIETSCTTGAGLELWLAWLTGRAKTKSAAFRAEEVGHVVGRNVVSPDTDVSTVLARRGITRRQLVKFCSAMLGTLALPERYLAQVVQAVGKARKPVLVWLQFQDCTGCSESMLRSSHPDVADVVLELLSWEYHEVIMAGAGKQANAVLDRVVKEDKGKYLVVVEGAIPTGDDGVYCTIGGQHAPWKSPSKVCRNAAATIAVGACAFDGGLVRSAPNPTGALGVHEARAGHQGDQHGRLPAQSGQYGRGAGALPDLQRSARARSIQPAAVRLRPHHSRSVRAARALRRRPFRHRVGRRRASQGLVPLQDGLQGSGGDLQLPGGAVERPYQLADPRRTWLHRCASPRFWDHMSPFYDRLPIVPGFRRRGHGGRDRPGAGRRGGGRRHRTRPDQDDQARAQTRLRPQPTCGRRQRKEDMNMARLVVDPVTRIEGHLRIEAQVDGGKISDAWSAGNDVSRHRADSARARSARSLDLGAAHLRSVHHGPRSGERARGGRRARRSRCRKTPASSAI